MEKSKEILTIGLINHEIDLKKTDPKGSAFQSTLTQSFLNLFI